MDRMDIRRTYQQMSRQDILANEREANPEDAARIKAEVNAFIQQENDKVGAFLITLRKDGRPHGRPVSTFVEGWTVGTISQGEHLKNSHIRNNPIVAYMWFELCPTSFYGMRSVWMQGACEIVEDKAEVDAFFARRAAATGRGNHHPNDDWTRLLLRTTPSLVRAEGFLGSSKPVLYRDFSA